MSRPDERKKTESYDQMIYSELGSSASRQDFRKITQLWNMNCIKLMTGMELPRPRNAMMSQLLSYMTHTLVQRQFAKVNGMVSGTDMSIVKMFE